jgi:hypothetical protein
MQNRRIKVQAALCKKQVLISKITRTKRTGRTAQMIEYRGNPELTPVPPKKNFFCLEITAFLCIE